MYSGGDDSCLKGWDLRVQNEKPAMLFTDRWSHRAGVCTIASDPHTECMLSSGSYDEILRSWDARNPSKPVIQQHVLARRVYLQPHSHTFRCHVEEVCGSSSIIPGGRECWQRLACTLDSNSSHSKPKNQASCMTTRRTRVWHTVSTGAKEWSFQKWISSPAAHSMILFSMSGMLISSLTDLQS